MPIPNCRPFTPSPTMPFPPEMRTNKFPSMHLTGHSMASLYNASCTCFASADVALEGAAAKSLPLCASAGARFCRLAAGRQCRGSCTSAMDPHMCSGTSVPAHTTTAAAAARCEVRCEHQTLVLHGAMYFGAPNPPTCAPGLCQQLHSLPQQLALVLPHRMWAELLPSTQRCGHC